MSKNKYDVMYGWNVQDSFGSISGNETTPELAIQEIKDWLEYDQQHHQKMHEYSLCKRIWPKDNQTGKDLPLKKEILIIKKVF